MISVKKKITVYRECASDVQMKELSISVSKHAGMSKLF